jgi:chromosome segregation ATPase
MSIRRSLAGVWHGMGSRAGIVTVAGSLMLGTLATAADPVTDLRASVTRGQQVGPAVRQGIAGLEAVPAAWDRSADRLTRYVQALQGKGGAVDPNALVQEVLRESYLQTTEDLRFYAEKVKYFNEQKKAVREYLGQLRDADARLKASGRAVPDLRMAELEHAATGLGAHDQEFDRIRERLASRAERLKSLSPRDANIMTTLTEVLQESIRQMNEDKQYMLKHLAEMNKAAAALSEQQRKVAEASAKLAAEEKDDEKQKVRPR